MIKFNVELKPRFYLVGKQFRHRDRSTHLKYTFGRVVGSDIKVHWINDNTHPREALYDKEEASRYIQEGKWILL